jgi:hypothetical protein
VSACPPSIEALREACASFGGYGRPDRSLAMFAEATGGRPNLADTGHRAALHRWLNAWGCRIAYPKDGPDDLFDRSVGEWWAAWSRRLPGPQIRLAELTDPQIEQVAAAYGALAVSPVARGRKSGSLRSLAPTAAAKALWVIRPHAVRAWDERIARRLYGGRDPEAFSAHLHLARCCAQSLLAEAGSEAALLEEVGRPDATVAKLLDEYWYVTVSRGGPV